MDKNGDLRDIRDKREAHVLRTGWNVFKPIFLRRIIENCPKILLTCLLRMLRTILVRKTNQFTGNLLVVYCADYLGKMI